MLRNTTSVRFCQRTSLLLIHRRSAVLLAEAASSKASSNPVKAEKEAPFGATLQEAQSEVGDLPRNGHPPTNNASSNNSQGGYFTPYPYHNYYNQSAQPMAAHGYPQQPYYAQQQQPQQQMAPAVAALLRGSPSMASSSVPPPQYTSNADSSTAGGSSVGSAPGNVGAPSSRQSSYFPSFATTPKGNGNGSVSANINNSRTLAQNSLFIPLPPPNKGIYTVREGEAWVVERRGVFNRVITAGTHFIMPYFEEVRYVCNITPMTTILPVSTIVTKDNMVVDLTGLLHLRIPMPSGSSTIKSSSMASLTSKKPWSGVAEALKNDESKPADPSTHGQSTATKGEPDTKDTSKAAKGSTEKTESSSAEGKGSSARIHKSASSTSIPPSNHPLQTICYSHFPDPVKYVSDLASRVLQSMAMDMTEAELSLAMTNVWVDSESYAHAESAIAAAANATTTEAGSFTGTSSTTEQSKESSSASASSSKGSSSTKIFTSPLGLRLAAMVNEALGGNFIKITECDLTMHVRAPASGHSSAHAAQSTEGATSATHSVSHSATQLDAQWAAYYEAYFAEHPYYQFEHHSLMRNVALQAEAQQVWAAGVAKSISLIAKAIEAAGPSGEKAADFLGKVGGGVMPPTK